MKRIIVTAAIVIITAILLLFAVPISANEANPAGGYGYGYGYETD